MEMIPRILIEYINKNITQYLGMKKVDEQTFKINTSSKSLIIKKIITKNELFFYQTYHNKLTDLGILLPKLYYLYKEDHNFWAIIEYFPFKLPEERWEADQKLISYLARIHKNKINHNIESAFYPQWTNQMTEIALSCFDPTFHKTMKHQLDTILSKSQHLFNSKYIINGNPGPKHWAINEKQDLILFNWSSIGHGHPAIDIAISICSSENRKTSMKAAKYYLEINDLGTSAQEFSDDILKACTWNYIYFLNNYMDNKTITPEKLIDHISEQFPQWLNTIYEELN